MIFDERLSKSTRLVADSDNRSNLRYVCIQVTCKVVTGESRIDDVRRTT